MASQSVLTRITTLESELNALKQEVGLIKDTHATTTDYGLTRLSTDSDVTNADMFALSAIEKNATVKGSMMNAIQLTAQRMGRTNVFSKGFVASNVGWYRLFAIQYNNGLEVRGSLSSILQIYLNRDYNNNNNETHWITNVNAYNNIVFKSMLSKSNTHIIKKIRKVASGNIGYIDIYYNSNERNSINIEFLSVFEKDILTEITMVPDTAEGETVLATYEIPANNI